MQHRTPPSPSAEQGSARPGVDAEAPIDAALARAIDAAIGSGIAVVDTTGRLIHVDDAFCRIVGWSREEMLGTRPPFDHWPEEHRPEIEEAFRLAVTGNFPAEGKLLVFRRRDGQRFPALLYLAPLRTGGTTQGWVANIIDRSQLGALAEVRAAAARFESERRLGALLQQSMVGVVELDLGGRFLAVNDRLCALTGYSREELLQRSARDITDPADREAVDAETRMLLSGELPAILERRCVRKDGSITWIATAPTLLRNEDGKPDRFYAFVLDINDIKLKQTELMKADERLQLAERAAGAGYWHWEFGSDRVTWSPALCALHGLDPDNPKPSYADWLAVVHPDDRSAVGARVTQAVNSHEPLFNEYRIVLADGSIRWINSYGQTFYDDQGRPLRMAGMSFDATPTHAREEALARHAEQLQLATDGAQIGIWYWSMRDNVLEWSDRCKMLLALPPGQQPTLARFYAVVHPDDRERVERLVAQAVERRSDYAAEYRIVDAEGAIRWISAQGRVYVNPGDDVRGMGGIVLDITDRKRNEDALRALTETLEAQVAERTAQAMAASAAKSEFLAHMSHEIRTPMSAVISLTQVLNQEDLTPEQSAVVRTIDQAGHSLLRIINDILDFSKIEAGQLQIEHRPFELAVLLNRVESLLHAAAQAKGLRFSIAAAPGNLRPLVGDALRLEQVLINLINNAIKFTSEGSVALTVVALGEAERDVRLRFEVRDTGIGISADALSILFQPFTQASIGITRRFGGTGLGLAICKRVVDLMGGEIGVASNPGEGSTFWFEVPLAFADRQSMAANAEGETPAAGPQLNGLRVLAVDDNRMNLFVVERLLKKEGVRVVLAADGQQALQILRANPQEFDLVLMDVQMPVMDGLTATRAIRAEPALAHLPVIALTAGVLVEEREMAISAGVDDFLPKPLDRKQMIAVLSSLRAGRSRVR